MLIPFCMHPSPSGGHTCIVQPPGSHVPLSWLSVVRPQLLPCISISGVNRTQCRSSGYQRCCLALQASLTLTACQTPASVLRRSS